VALAEQHLQKVLRLLPRHAQALDMLARILVLRGDFTGAAAHLERLCSAQPLVPTHWVRLSACYNMAGDKARAEQVMQRAHQQGADEQALAALHEAITAPSHERQAALLDQYHHRKDDQTCETAAYLFIADHPDHPLGWQVLGALLRQTGRMQEALRVSEQAAERFGQSVYAWGSPG
jgi:predicted Zn-dependent protease